ncbi:MFS transporter [Nocardia sp. NRRL WC-3656]|uniref:MFS transporter n=1 Tax=Nocardia sp. NRRL WC-3656 TaxID=1463824 RepID=UPI00068BED2B|nr:MFS transporter [Nocardia sp. NRRL WC-3656]
MTTPTQSTAAEIAAAPTTIRRPVVLWICCMSMLLVGADATAVNVALPAIGREFGIEPTGLAWVIDAYTLILATFMMAAASVSDRVGRKRTFRIGIVVFTIASALCAFAPGRGWLVTFRAFQAVGATMLNPIALAILVSTFPDRADRARAVGVWSGANGLSLALGPVIGGALAGSTFGWRWIFLINLPVGAAMYIATKYFIQESKAATPRAVDLIGQALLASMLATMTFGILEGRELGWASPAIVGTLATALAALAGLLIYEPRRAEPLIELRLFRSPPFAGANLIAVAAFASMGSFLFLNSIYLEQIRGYRPLHAGLLTLPLAAAAFVVGPVNGRILARLGPRPSLLAGGSALTAGALMLTFDSTNPSTPQLLAAYVALGTGIAAVSAPITHIAAAGLPAGQAGVVGGIAGVTRQFGQTVGVAVAATILTGTGGETGSRNDAVHRGWYLNVVYGALVLAGAAISTRNLDSVRRRGCGYRTRRRKPAPRA